MEEGDLRPIIFRRLDLPMTYWYPYRRMFLWSLVFGLWSFWECLRCVLAVALALSSVEAGKLHLLWRDP